MNPTLDTAVGVGGKIDTGTGKILSGPMTGSTATTGAPITSSSLAPTTPAVIPPTSPTSSPLDSLSGYLSSISDSFTKSLDANAATAKGGYTDSLDALTKALSSSPSEASLTNSAYSSTVDPLSKELNSLNAQLTAEQVGNRHAIEQLQANPGGLSTGALAANVAQMQRQSLSKQADLAVIISAKNGELSTASAIADRAVAAKVADQKQRIDALQTIFNENKDLFTKAEQEQFQTAQADRNRQLDTMAYQEKAKYDEMIKQSDPLYQQQLIKARNDAAISSPGGSSFLGGPVSVVNTPSGAQPVTTYKIQAGEDPYNIAQANGTDIATLQKLNPQITDWHNIQPGTSLNLPDQSNSWLAGKTPEQVQAFNSIPDSLKGSVQQLITGDALLADIVKSRGASGTAQINQIINAARSVDPNFSVNRNKQMYAYQQQFNNPNGKEQTQIVAINTGLGHLAEFNNAASALGNNALLPYNQLKNYLAKNAGDPAVSNFNTVVTALSSELATIYKGGTAPSQEEIQNWRDNILSSFSKSQSQGVADTTSTLISNKLQSLAQSYKNVMGRYPANPIINPDALQQLQSAGVNVQPIVDKLNSQGYQINLGGGSGGTVVTAPDGTQVQITD